MNFVFAILELFVSVTYLHFPYWGFFGVLEKRKYMMLSCSRDTIATYNCFGILIGRAESFLLRCKTAGLERLPKVLWWWVQFGLWNIRVWIERDKKSDECCDENRRLAERRYEALSRCSSVVGLFVFVLPAVCTYSVGIGVYHCVSRCVRREWHEYGDCLERISTASCLTQNFPGMNKSMYDVPKTIFRTKLSTNPMDKNL